MHKRTWTATTAAALALLAAGCSSATAGKSSAAAGALATASSYQSAVNAARWHTMCQLSTAALRHGSVDACVAANSDAAAPTTMPTATASVAGGTYADGSSVPPMATPSAVDTRSATVGQVRIDSSEPVSAQGAHPAGTGVMVTFTVTEPDGHTTIERRALRLVDQGGTWLVDQSVTVHDSDISHGDPIGTALSTE